MKRAIAVASTVLGIAAFVYTLSGIGIADVQQAIGARWLGLRRDPADFRTPRGGQSRRVDADVHGHAIGSRSPTRFRARLAGEALSALLPMGFLVGEPTKAQYVDDRMPFATAFSALMLEFAFYGASLALLAGAACWRSCQASPSSAPASSAARISCRSTPRSARSWNRSAGSRSSSRCAPHDRRTRSRLPRARDRRDVYDAPLPHSGRRDVDRRRCVRDAQSCRHHRVQDGADACRRRRSECRDSWRRISRSARRPA